MTEHSSRSKKNSGNAANQHGWPRPHKVGKRSEGVKKVISPGPEQPRGLTDATPPPELGENLNA